MLAIFISVMVILYVVWFDSKFRLKKELSYSAYYKLMFTEYFNYAFLTKPDDDNRVLSKELVNYKKIGIYIGFFTKTCIIIISYFVQTQRLQSTKGSKSNQYRAVVSNT